MRDLSFILTFLLLFFTGSGQLFGQELLPDGRFKVLGTLYQGDTIPLIYLNTVDISEALPPGAEQKLKEYLKLKRDVARAYPYARLAATQLKWINDSLQSIPGEKQRKKFVKDQEKLMKARFEKDLKKLTVTQGRILIKLVDRETGSTSYELVKELRGSFQAFLWQGLAKLFGSNLKSVYDSKGEDLLIEDIVRQIERGEIPVKRITVER